jgi:hypothetical protein
MTIAMKTASKNKENIPFLCQFASINELLNEPGRPRRIQTRKENATKMQAKIIFNIAIPIIFTHRSVDEPGGDSSR